MSKRKLFRWKGALIPRMIQAIHDNKTFHLHLMYLPTRDGHGYVYQEKRHKNVLISEAVGEDFIQAPRHDFCPIIMVDEAIRKGIVKPMKPEESTS